VIADNKFGSSGPWPVGIGPQDSITNEVIRDVVFERNTFDSHSDVDVRVSVHVWAQDVTVRNNVFDATGASSYYTAVEVTRRANEPPPQNVKVINNTMYRGDAGSEFIGCLINSVAQDTTVRNNVLYAPQSTSTPMISGAGSGLVQGNNLVTVQQVFVDAANPYGADGVPGTADDGLRLRATLPGGAPSPLIDAGYDVGLRFDFAAHSRFDDPNTPNTGGGTRPYFDIGVYEYRSP
jgi:hypothetical protein